MRRAADWRLDYGLRRACANDVMNVCRDEVLAAKSKVSASGKVLAGGVIEKKQSISILLLLL